MNQISQVVVLPDQPSHIYEMLTDPVLHEAFTGAPATIGASAGDTFTAYDGYISGKILELIPGKLIRQTWVAEEENWPEGHESEVTFQLRAEGDHTVVEFVHSNIPDGMKESFEEGWEQYYWEPMRAFLASA